MFFGPGKAYGQYFPFSVSANFPCFYCQRFDYICKNKGVYGVFYTQRREASWIQQFRFPVFVTFLLGQPRINIFIKFYPLNLLSHNFPLSSVQLTSHPFFKYCLTFSTYFYLRLIRMFSSIFLTIFELSLLISKNSTEVQNAILRKTYTVPPNAEISPLQAN